MSHKHSAAAKKRWSVLSPESRSKRMAHVATKKWEGMSKKDRKEHIQKMVKGRVTKKS